MKTITLVCTECGAVSTVREGAPVPVCCGLPMKASEPLAGCTTTETAEQARSGRSDEPCDDGTGAKPKP